MRDEKLGELNARVGGGTDGRGGGDGPIVVLLHGFGAAGDDLVPLARVLDVPARTRFVFPEAPLALPMYAGGRAWWMIDIERMERAMAGETLDRSDEKPEGAAEARAAVIGMLDALEVRLGPTGAGGAPLFLGGFSQGAMVSCDVALATTRPLAGLILLSGTLLMSSEWQAAAPARRGLQVLQSHGRADPLLPYAAAQQLRKLLEGAGLPVEWIEHGGGHDIPDSVIDGVGRFVTRLAGG